MRILGKDGVISSIISKGHGDLQSAYASLLLVGDFVSDGENQNNSSYKETSKRRNPEIGHLGVGWI